jgi:hypothetical protein
MAGLIAIIVLFPIVVAACEFGTKGVIYPPPKDTSVWIVPSISGTSAPMSPKSSGRPGKAVPGRATIELAKSSFHEGEIVRVTVANGLDQSLYTNNQKSACTIVTLERLHAGTWERIGGCGMEMLPSVVEIGPGDVVEVAINPHSNLWGIDTSKGLAFGIGTYRVSFSYWLAGKDKVTTVASPEFAVTR